MRYSRGFRLSSKGSIDQDPTLGATISYARPSYGQIPTGVGSERGDAGAYALHSGIATITAGRLVSMMIGATGRAWYLDKAIAEQKKRLPVSILSQESRQSLQFQPPTRGGRGRKPLCLLSREVRRQTVYPTPGKFPADA